MTTLHGRINRAVTFCRLFGLGHLHGHTYRSYAIDAVFLLMNAAASALTYHRVTANFVKRVPELWDVTTVLSVFRFYVRLFVPSVIVAIFQYKKRAVTEIVSRLDDLVPATTTGTAAAGFLRSFARYAVGWSALILAGEVAALTMFHFRTKFAVLTATDFVLNAVQTNWSVIPVFQFLFVIKAVTLGVRDINGRIASVRQWKAARREWKQLRTAAVDVTNDVFGEIIIFHVAHKLVNANFLFFLAYFYGYKNGDRLQTLAYLFEATLNGLWVVELFRQCQNCKLEMLKTKTILNSLNMNTLSEFKEFKYTALYMLHTDFNLMPCGIFEMNYRHLLLIVASMSAFLVLQIQMKLH